MLEWVQKAGGWALAIGFKMGLPLALLFALGYAAYRRQRALGIGPLVAPSGVGDGPHSEAVRPRQTPCWEVKGCPPDVRAQCPAFWHPDVPCWRAVAQASGGCIQARCLQCSLFLSRSGPGR